jgi:hypothetical protein
VLSQLPLASIFDIRNFWVKEEAVVRPCCKDLKKVLGKGGRGLTVAGEAKKKNTRNF